MRCECLIRATTYDGIIISELQPYPFDTYRAYGRAKALMCENPEFKIVQLAPDEEQLNAGWYYLFDRDPKEHDVTRLTSVTPTFREAVLLRYIADYFRSTSPEVQARNNWYNPTNETKRPGWDWRA